MTDWRYCPKLLACSKVTSAHEEGTKQAEIFSAFPIDESQVKTLLPQLEVVFKTRLEAFSVPLIRH